MKKLFLILIVLVTVTSCQKSLEDLQPEQTPAQNMKDMKVASDFSWKTTRDITLTVKGFVNGILEVKSAEGIVYQKAFLRKGASLTLKLTVPAYEDAIILSYMGQSVETKLDGSDLNYEFKLQ